MPEIDMSDFFEETEDEINQIKKLVAIREAMDSIKENLSITTGVETNSKVGETHIILDSEQVIALSHAYMDRQQKWAEEERKDIVRKRQHRHEEWKKTSWFHKLFFEDPNKWSGFDEVNWVSMRLNTAEAFVRSLLKAASISSTVSLTIQDVDKLIPDVQKNKPAYR